MRYSFMEFIETHHHTPPPTTPPHLLYPSHWPRDFVPLRLCVRFLTWRKVVTVVKLRLPVFNALETVVLLRIH